MHWKVTTLAAALPLTLGAHAQAAPGDTAAQVEERRRCDKSNDDVQEIRSQAAQGSDLLQGLEYTKDCLADACAETTRKNCEENRAWLEREVPFVVLTASRGDKEVTPDTIVVDDRPLDPSNNPWKTDGRKRRINPGRHLFVFSLNNETVRVERTISQAATETIAAVFAASEPPPPALKSKPSGPVEASAPPDSAVTTPDANAEPQAIGNGSPLRTLGYVGAGAGGVGLAIGAIFGLKAGSKLDDSKKDPNGAGCDANDVCGATGKTARTDAQAAATVSTFGFVIGSVLLTSGLALIIFAPSGTRSGSKVAPTVGLNGGGITIGGGF